MTKTTKLMLVLAVAATSLLTVGVAQHRRTVAAAGTTARQARARS